MSPPEPALPVCSTCNDTHRMLAPEDVGGDWMCTHCPVPCSKCRQGGRGPYCATTPCACVCHRRNVSPPDPAAPAPEPDEAHQAAWAWLDTTYQPATADQDAPSLAALLRAWRDQGNVDAPAETLTRDTQQLAEMLRAAERRGWERACEEACEVVYGADDHDSRKFASTLGCILSALGALRERGPR